MQKLSSYSFPPFAGKFWKSSFVCTPPAYDFNTFKRGVSRHLTSWFWQLDHYHFFSGGSAWQLIVHFHVWATSIVVRKHTPVFDALDGAEWWEHWVHNGGKAVGVTLLLVDGDTLPLRTFGLHIVLPEVTLLLAKRARDAPCVLTNHWIWEQKIYDEFITLPKYTSFFKSLFKWVDNISKWARLCEALTAVQVWRTDGSWEVVH